jgi:hypothetical protein
MEFFPFGTTAIEMALMVEDPGSGDSTADPGRGRYRDEQGLGKRRGEDEARLSQQGDRNRTEIWKR